MLYRLCSWVTQSGGEDPWTFPGEGGIGGLQRERVMQVTGLYEILSYPFTCECSCKYILLMLLREKKMISDGN